MLIEDDEFSASGDADTPSAGENTGGLSEAMAPHYTGHRDRLKKRFLKQGESAFEDYELLELMLFRSIPRRDVKPIAKALTAKFGSFAEVLAASPKRLKEVSGIGESVITDLKLIEAAARRITRSRVIGKPILGAWNEVVDYCHTVMAYTTEESFRILFLDRKNQLIADELQQVGTVDHTPVYPREVIKRALELSASAIVLVHNHPSGDPNPSNADLVMTRRILEIASSLGIEVHDHIIIGKSGHLSFRATGKL